MEQELGRGLWTFDLRIDHWDAYDLERGDVFTLDSPDLPNVKVRVLEAKRDWLRGWLFRLIEVL